METPEENKSVRNPDWHPRQSNAGNTNPQYAKEEPKLGLFARTELKKKIEANFPPERVNELYRQEGLNKAVPERDPKPVEDEPTLDPLTKAELETRIAALYPPERMQKLFEQEGVSKKDSVHRSFKRKVLDFLKI